MKANKILMTCILVGMTSCAVVNAATVGTPIQPTCLQTSFTATAPSNQWYTGVNIGIKNNCSTAVDLKNASVSFAANLTSGISTVWSWPFSSTPATYQGGVASFSLIFQGDQYSPSTVAVGASQTLSFGMNLSGQTFNVAAAQQSLQVIPNGTPPAPSNGEIDIKVNPTGTSGITGSQIITVSSGSFNQPVTNSVWNTVSTYPVKSLAYGTYTISAAPLSNYNTVVTPSTVAVNNATPQVVTLTYVAKPAVGTVSINLPAAPLANISGGTPVTLQDQTSQQTASKTTNWNSTATFSSLAAGDKVQASVPSVTNGQYIATPNPLPALTVVKNQTLTQTVSYQVTPQTTVPVSFTITGLSSNNATVTLTDAYSNTYSYGNLGNGSVSKPLPVNGSYNVAASAPNLVASITPSSFNTTNTGPANPINISFAPFTKQLAAYWAGWSGYQYDLNGTYGQLPLTTIYLAFANYTGQAIDSSVSGYFSVVPVANSQIQPTYQDWTTYAYKHPNVKMVMSVGGASFSAMWANLNSTQAAQNMANAIVKVLNTTYPVYAPAGSNPQVAFAINGAAGSQGPQYGNSSLLGTVSMSGVDLDVEVADAATLNAMTPYLLTLAKTIHAALPDKTISFAVFSVAADPVGACTVPGSAHCGEALPLIAAINGYSDPSLKAVVSYNVMAYDANSSFVLGANPLYQTALQNYVAAVGDPSKVILGVDLQSQWGTPYFTETCAQLTAEAQWAYQHPKITGGTFLWEIGDDSNLCTAYNALSGMAGAMQGQ